MKQRQIPWVLTFMLASALLWQACKDPDRLKPNDKFYCKVDGKAWRPDSDGDFKAITLTADISENNRFLGIIANNYKTDETIVLSITDTTGFNKQSSGKTYDLSLNYSFQTHPPSAYFLQGKLKYTTNDLSTGSFRILSLERDSRLPASIMMRAEFEFNAVSPAGKTIKISNGQFNSEVRILQ